MKLTESNLYQEFRDNYDIFQETTEVEDQIHIVGGKERKTQEVVFKRFELTKKGWVSADVHIQTEVVDFYKKFKKIKPKMKPTRL